jgi:NitT/TauT family transport system substrate-binding protein
MPGAGWPGVTALFPPPAGARPAAGERTIGILESECAVIGRLFARPLVALLAALALGAACAPAAAPPAAVPAAATAPAAAPVAQVPAQPAAGATAPPTVAAPLAPPVDVKMSIFGATTDAGVFIAIERGYFRAEGLNIETVPSDSSLQITPFLASGQIDVAGISQSPALFNAALRGVPYRLVADKGRILPGHGFAAIVVRTDLVESGRVRDLSDLRGLRINTPGKGTASWGLLARALDAGGVSADEVEFESLLQPDVIPALGNRALDATLLLEPFVSAAVTRGVGVRFRGADEYAVGAQNGMIAYSPQFAAQREPAQRFMLAYLKGLRDYVDAFDSGVGQDEIVDILIKSTPIKDRAVYATMKPAGFEPNGRVNVDYLRADQELYVREGMMTETVDIPSLVDHQYVDYAVERLGRR